MTESSLGGSDFEFKICVKDRYWRNLIFKFLPKLLTLTGFLGTFSGTEDAEKNISDIVVFTQENWLRNGKERWNSYFDHLNSLPVDQLFTFLRICFERQNPKSLHHDYWVIMGARVESMIERMKFASLLHSDGYITSEIIFLTGDRHLLTEEMELVVNFAKMHDIQCINKIENENQVPIVLSEWLKRNVKNVKVNHVPSSKPDGAVRSNTFDTLKELMRLLTSKHIGDAPSILLITSSVYVLYQAVVAEAVFSQDGVAKQWLLDSAGDGNVVTNEVTLDSIGYALDSIARAVYFLSKTNES